MLRVDLYSLVDDHIAQDFPNPTPKEHLEAFKRSLNFLKIEKTSFRSAKYLDTSFLFTTVSFM